MCGRQIHLNSSPYLNRSSSKVKVTGQSSWPDDEFFDYGSETAGVSMLFLGFLLEKISTFHTVLFRTYIFKRFCS